MKVGQQVKCNGFIGRVIRVLDGQLKGMYEVRLGSGTVCVEESELTPV